MARETHQDCKARTLILDLKQNGSVYAYIAFEKMIYINQIKMTIDEIMNGSSAKNFPGLVPLVQDYLRNIEVDTDTMCTLSRYLIYIQRKSQCQMMTNARFIRNFVQSVSGGITKFSKKLLTFAIFRNTISPAV